MPEAPLHSRFDAVAIAASAGGLRALRAVIDALPADFPAALLVVMHMLRDRPNQLAALLQPHTALRVKDVEQDEPLRAGTVYIAPSDWHFEVAAPGVAHLTQAPMVHFTRPAADPLFETVAAVYARRAICVVLTGSGIDGSAGATAIKAGGGVVIAQDPAGAEYSGMPHAAIATGCVDYVLPLDQIAIKLIQLAMPASHLSHE